MGVMSIVHVLQAAQKVQQINTATQKSYEDWLIDYSFLAINKPYLRVWLSEYAHPYLNIVTYAHFDGEQQANEAIKEVVALARNYNVPICWRITPSMATESVPSLLQQYGFVMTENIIVMAYFFDEILNEAEIFTDKDFSIKRITQKTEMLAWLQVVSEQYESDPIFKQAYYDVLIKQDLSCNKTAYYGAYYQGALVATGGLAINNYVGEIFSLATSFVYQKKGIATAMINFMLQEAKNASAHFVMISNSATLIPFYIKRGFREIFEIQEFIYRP
jgi:GNAT superfamily N-acetyltransferase